MTGQSTHFGPHWGLLGGGGGGELCEEICKLEYIPEKKIFIFIFLLFGLALGEQKWVLGVDKIVSGII